MSISSGFNRFRSCNDGVRVLTQQPLGSKVDLAEFVVEIVAVGLQIDALIASAYL